MKAKLLFLLTAISVGYVFNLLHVPAGWLLGALVTGLVCGIYVTQLTFNRTVFKLTLTFIGANISLLLSVEILKAAYIYILPLLFSVLIFIISGIISSLLLYKKAEGVNLNTAFFCCIPGGATEIIGISDAYDADARIVAAFHSVRIIVFTMTIPLIISMIHSPTSSDGIEPVITAFNGWTVLFFIIVMAGSYLLAKTFRLPGGFLLFSILIGFVVSQFVFEVPPVSNNLKGIGQALIGGLVGLRFDRASLRQLRKIGPVTIFIVLKLFVLTLVITLGFMYVTDLSYATSLISIVPAGAPEMTITAVALGIEPTIVATLHIVRILFIFMMLPILLKISGYLNRKFG